MAKLRPIRILFAGLGNVREELKLADQMVESWNRLHSERFGVVVKSWYSSAFPVLNLRKRPWGITADESIAKAHLFVTISRSRPGVATGNAEADAVEAARRHIGEGEYRIVFTSDLVLEADNLAEEQDSSVKVRASFLKNTSCAKFLVRSRFKRMFAVDLAHALNLVLIRKPGRNVLEQLPTTLQGEGTP